MADTPAETAREIEETRARLDTDLRELEDRLPSPKEIGRRAAEAGGRAARVAAGATAGGTALWLTVRTVRSRRRAKARPAAVRAVERVLPEGWPERVESLLEERRNWKTLAGIGAGVWVLFRVLELRQLGRLNRATIAG